MYLAYVDESGDGGTAGSQTFCLGCVLVESPRWPDVFDDVIEFRRFLRDQFKLPMRAEVKANYLLQNGGPFRSLKLNESTRFRIYRGFMRLQGKLGIKVFAVVVRKDLMAAKKLILDPRHVAWEYLFQRLERFTTKGITEVMVLHDLGDGGLVRTLARKARRAGSAGMKYGQGGLKRPARLILDDPVPRHSHESYFIQIADLVAYAAFRRVIPPPARPVQICPTGMWDELGPARFAPVNALSGGPPGIVSWPP